MLPIPIIFESGSRIRKSRIVIGKSGSREGQPGGLNVKSDYVKNKSVSFIGKFGNANGTNSATVGKFGCANGKPGRVIGKFGTLKSKFGTVIGKFGTVIGKFGNLKNKFGVLTFSPEPPKISPEVSSFNSRRLFFASVAPHFIP